MGLLASGVACVIERLVAGFDDVGAWGLAVYQDGTLCLDIIQNKWSPSYTVSSVLTSIQSLLTDPNCGSPANPEAAELFLQDKKAYNRRVRRLTEESLGGS